MLQALAQFIQTTNDATAAFLTVEHAVYNWTQLGLFTGSLVSDYTQTCHKAGVCYNTIPNTPDAGIWAGRPLVFVRVGFTFYTASQFILPVIK
jgi:hypothetical protein